MGLESENFLTEMKMLTSCIMKRMLSQIIQSGNNSVVPTNCTDTVESVNITAKSLNISSLTHEDYHSIFLYCYVIVTGLLLTLGLTGNCICLHVAMTRRLIRQASSQYFFVFSFCDVLVLIFYVLPEWLERGIYPISHIQLFRLNAIEGVCQIFLFLSYWLRFLSVWILVLYSIERYINLRNPFYRKRICHRIGNAKLLGGLGLISMLLTLWKTLSSALLATGNNDILICTSQSDKQMYNFIYDSIYAALISVIPSFLILIFNVLIARHLFIIRKEKDSCLSHQEMIGFQFAGLLVLISFCFLILTWPYYFCWIHDWWVHRQMLSGFTSDLNTASNSIETRLKTWKFSAQSKLITRIIFYSHFSINFFLYTFTSRFFRAEMKRLFTLRSLRRRARQFYTDDYLIDKELLVHKNAIDQETQNNINFLKDHLSLNTI